MTERPNCIKCDSPISNDQHRLWIKLRLSLGKSPVGWPKVCSMCVLKSLMSPEPTQEGDQR